MTGERCDVIFEADQEVGNYWMKAYSSRCGVTNAIIRYKWTLNVDPEGDRDTARTSVVSMSSFANLKENH